MFEAEARRLGRVDWLVQGTLYPDVIESVKFLREAQVTIKTHHNVGGLPERMNLKLVEPLRELFKDEVRALGRDSAYRRACGIRFPGPGLAVGSSARSRGEARIRRSADEITSTRSEAGVYDEVWQAFACCCRCRRRA